MRKIFSLLLLVLLVPVVQSCLHDEKEFFGQSAAERIDATVKADREILEAAPEGWVLEYYMGEKYSGPAVTMLIKFKNGKAYLASDLSDELRTDTCDYDVDKSQGPVLTFNTYARTIHQLAGGRSGDPEGFQGDYEFMILKASADSVLLRGKKWHNDMVLKPIQSPATIATYYDDIVKLRQKVVNENFIFYYKGDSLCTASIDAGSRTFTAHTADGTQESPLIFTPTGIYLREGFEVGGKVYTAFTWDDSSLSFVSGDLKARMDIPDTFKPLDFWVGTWTLKHSIVASIGNVPTLLKVTDTPDPLLDNGIKGVLTFNHIDYDVTLAYNKGTGTISFPMQIIKDPSGTYAGGIYIVSFSGTVAKIPGQNGLLENLQEGMTFVWDKATQTATAVGQIDADTDYQVEGFRGIALNESGSPVIANNRYVQPIVMVNLTSMQKN